MTDRKTVDADSIPDPDRDAFIAGVDLVARTGATSFEVGYLHDDVPVAQAGWWATATYRGAKIMMEDGWSATEVVDRLAHRLLRGATCNRCKKRVTLKGEHPAQCRWWREGDGWVQGCSLRNRRRPK